MHERDPEKVGRRLLESFEKGYPHLKMRVVWNPLQKRAWAATVRLRKSEKLVAKGVKHDRLKAIEAAIESIPEEHRRAR